MNPRVELPSVPSPRPASERAPDGPVSPDRSGPPRRRPATRVQRARRILLAVILVVVPLQALAFSGTYLLYSRHYVTTTNARVDGDQVDITAPATGVLTGWTATPGSAVDAHQVLGRISIQDSAGPQRTIRAPGSGVVAVNQAVEGQYVQQGDRVAVAYDYRRLYLTARLDEFDIARVRPGQPVEIRLDGFPGARVWGVVVNLQGSTGGPFSPYPSPDVDPQNPQKVQQYVPVRIGFTSTDGAALLPGMNATVHIRTDG